MQELFLPAGTSSWQRAPCSRRRCGGWPAVPYRTPSRPRSSRWRWATQERAGRLPPRRRSQWVRTRQAWQDSVPDSVAVSDLQQGLEPCAPSKRPLCCSLGPAGLLPQWHRELQRGGLPGEGGRPIHLPKCRGRVLAHPSHGSAGKGGGFWSQGLRKLEILLEVLLKGCVSPNCLSFPWGHKPSGSDLWAVLIFTRNNLNPINSIKVLSPSLACDILQRPDHMGSFSTWTLHSIYNLLAFLLNIYCNIIVNPQLWVLKLGGQTCLFFPVSPIRSIELNIYKLLNKFELNVNNSVKLKCTCPCRNHHVQVTFSS